MDDYLVLVLENQKRLREMDPEAVKRRLEEQGAPAEDREEALHRILRDSELRPEGQTAPVPEENQSPVQTMQRQTRRTGDPLEEREPSVGANGYDLPTPSLAHASPGAAAFRVPEAAEVDAIPTGMQGDDTRTLPEEQGENSLPHGTSDEENQEDAREEALRQMERALEEYADGNGNRAGTGLEETEAPENRKTVPETTGEKDRRGTSGETQEEQKNRAGAREILRRLEAVEFHTRESREGAGYPAEKTAERSSGMKIDQGTVAGDGYWAEKRRDGYLRQMAQAILERQEHRIIRVTEQKTSRGQTLSPQGGQDVPVYQLQRGEVDPEGLSRIFQRDARRYS